MKLRAATGIGGRCPSAKRPRERGDSGALRVQVSISGFNPISILRELRRNSLDFFRICVRSVFHECEAGRVFRLGPAQIMKMLGVGLQFHFVHKARSSLPTRILIADDHESVRHGLRAMLEAHPGWEVCGEAVDGVEAVAKARELKPDLVVLDFAMPRLDGLKAAALISKDSPGVPIILHTMYGSALPLEIENHGVSRVVGKADTGTLVKAVQELSADYGAA